VDGTDAAQLSHGEVEGRRQIVGALDAEGLQVRTQHGFHGGFPARLHIQLFGKARGLFQTLLAQPALQTGAIDAWATWAPYTVAALADGARIIVDGRRYSSGYGFDVANTGAIADKLIYNAQELLSRGSR
jgi:hypothetical protein